MIRKLFVVSALVAGSSLLTAAPSAADTAPIAAVLKTLSNPYWVAMRDGIAAEAKKRGVSVDIVSGNSEDDIEGQQRLMEDVVNKNYKGIIVAPISPVSLIPAIVKANHKGIYVVNVDERVDTAQLKAAGGSLVAYVGTDDLKVGQKAASFIVKQLGSAGGKVAIIEGKAGNASGEARVTGATGVFKATHGVTLVASQPANWDRAKALDVTTNILERNPDLRAIYAANDTMALGAVQAVKNAGKGGKVIVVGTDGAPEAVSAVKSGDLAATVGQKAAEIGAKAVDILLDDIKSGKPVSGMTMTDIKIDSQLITK